MRKKLRFNKDPFSKKADEKEKEIKTFDVADIQKEIDNLTTKTPYETSDEEEDLDFTDKKEKIDDVKPELPDESEVTPIKFEENTSFLNWNRILLYLSVMGIVCIVIIPQYVNELSPVLTLLMWLFGMACFLPVGAILGWLFFNVETRCKIMRRMRGKDYGIVNFVHKGGKRITSRIKDFGEDIIVQDTRMWIIDANGVYYLDRDRNKIMHARIKSQDIITLPSNIPSLYLDAETMIPLKFHKEKSKSNPQQAGATILGHISNQIAKNLFFKKTMTYYTIITIAITCLTLVVALLVFTEVSEMKEALTGMETELKELKELVKNLQPPPTI